LLQRGSKLLPLAQRLDVIDPNALVVGLEFQRAFEQELGIVEDPEACTDIREQPHALDVMRHFLKKLSAEFFRFDQFALRDKVEHGQQRLRQSPQRFELRRDLCGLLFEAFSAKYLQLPPPISAGLIRQARE
jgi:hypothetical protein